MVLIKDEEKNKGKCSIEIVEKFYKGKDDVIQTLNSAFVFTRTSLRYGKMNKYIQDYKPQETKCRCNRIQIMKNSSDYW